MDLGCPISQSWTPHRQDKLTVAGATASSSAANTEKGQEQDQLASTRVDECRSARGCDHGRGQQAGEEEQGEGREDERDVRQRAKMMVHACCEMSSWTRNSHYAGQYWGWCGTKTGEEAPTPTPSAENWVARRQRHEGREKRSRMANEVTITEPKTIIIVQRYRWSNELCLTGRSWARPI
jgi:hypothetical protein